VAHTRRPGQRRAGQRLARLCGAEPGRPRTGGGGADMRRPGLANHEEPDAEVNSQNALGKGSLIRLGAFPRAGLSRFSSPRLYREMTKVSGVLEVALQGGLEFANFVGTDQVLLHKAAAQVLDEVQGDHAPAVVDGIRGA
jgi:hypothetical protein